MALNNPGNVYKYLINCCEKDGFYSPKKLLTYGRPWIFSTGSRSIGKSTGFSIFFILDYILNGHKFVYTRRTKDETLLTCSTYFGNAVQIINRKTDITINEFYYEGGHYYIRYNDKETEEECGHTIPLSQEQKYKSTNLSDVFNLIYDEFIAKESTQYLGSSATPETEYVKLLSLYTTIDRGINTPYRNETRFFFAGNTATIYNPIYLSLGISSYINEGSKIIAPKKKLWILEQTDYVEALGNIEDSFVYQLSNEQEKDYNFRNKGADPKSFIGVPDICFYDYTVILDGIAYGISHDRDRYFYIGKSRPEVGKPKISLDIKGHDGNDLKLITHWSKYPIMQMVSEAYQDGRLYFNNGKTQVAFLKWLKYMP